MSNRKDRRRDSRLKEPQKVEIKEKKLGETLSIILPIIGVFVFLVGSLLLFFHLESGRWIPDEGYLNAEELVNSGELIGKTFDECALLIGDSFAVKPEVGDSKDWEFLLVGYKDHTNGVGSKSFGIYIQHKDGESVKAVLEETRQ